MSSILLILCVLYVIKALLTTSLMPRRWAWVAFGAVCAGFVWFSHGYALQQNKLALEAMMEGQKILTDVSLVIMVDLLLTLGFCQSVLNRGVGIPQKRAFRILGYIPPVLMFPVLYYAQVNMFFSFVGVDFVMLTAILSASALLLMIGGTFFVRRLLPDADLRVELAALLELFIFLLAICCTIFHPSALMYTADSPVDWRTLLFTAGVFVSLLAVGWAWYFLKEKVKSEKRKVKN